WTRRPGRTRWWSRRRFGGKRGRAAAAAADSAPHEHVRDGTDLPGRKESARRPRVPAGDGLPQEAAAAVPLSPGNRDVPKVPAGSLTTGASRSRGRPFAATASCITPGRPGLTKALQRQQATFARSGV